MIGDIQPKGVDPLEQFYDIERQGVRLPRRPGISVPPGKDPLWRNLMDLQVKLQCGTYFTKKPNWLEPPVTAKPLDLSTEECVTISGAASGFGALSTLITFTVPDRHVGALLGFGHEIENPAQWGDVFWTLRINKAPLPLYHNIRRQIGRFVDPTLFPASFRFTGGDVIEVVANKGGAAAACAFARLIGFYFPVRSMTQDGSYAEYHTI